MIKRIALLFAITGAGYGFSIVALKYLAEYGSVNQVAGIAEVESLIQFLIGLIGFGMQGEAIRSISFASDWKERLGDAQRARFTLSLLLMFIAVFSFFNQYYLYFLMAPLVALNSDYALYARGFPILGSVIAFFRVVTPLLAALISATATPSNVLITYFSANAVVYFLTNAVIAWYLKAPLFYLPTLTSLKLYLNTIPLGIINLCFYFFGLGILLLAQFFFSDKELIVSFVALKFYLIYKGAIRVIHQAFVNRMREDIVCLSIDRICIMIGVLLFGSILIFPTTFINLFFGEQFTSNIHFFVLLGVSIVSFSIFNSASTKALLERKDIAFMKVLLIGVFVSTSLLFTLFQFNKSASIIMIALCVGETICALMQALTFFSWSQVRLRLLFLISCATGLVLPWLAKMWVNEGVFTYLISFSLLGILMLLFTHKKLVLPQIVNESAT
jgi:hypothetical protein